MRGFMNCRSRSGAVRLAALLVATVAAIASCLIPSANATPVRAAHHAAAPRLVDRAYVVAQSGGIASFKLFSDGSIRPGGPTLPTGSGTFGILAGPSNHYLYVEPGLGLGTQYSLTQPPMLETVRILPDGQLRRVGTPIALDPALTAVTGAISPDGRNLYLGVGVGVAGFNNGAVMHFRIGRNGVPVQQGAPVPLGLSTDGAAEPIIAPDGKSLYVASYLAESIVRFAIHRDGSLSSQPIDRTPAGSSPITPVISPNGRFLYIDNELSQTIRAFAIEADDSLQEVPGSPFASGYIPHNFAFSKDGKYLYSANTGGDSPDGLQTGDGSISAFAVHHDGSLIPLPGSPYPSLAGPVMVNRSTDGNWLYVTSSPQSGTGRAVMLTSYKISRDGTLDLSRTHSLATGQQVADGPETVVLPTGRGCWCTPRANRQSRG